jgi:hypothetical protein
MTMSQMQNFQKLDKAKQQKMKQKGNPFASNKKKLTGKTPKVRNSKSPFLKKKYKLKFVDLYRHPETFDGDVCFLYS